MKIDEAREILLVRIVHSWALLYRSSESDSWKRLEDDAGPRVFETSDEALEYVRRCSSCKPRVSVAL